MRLQPGPPIWVLVRRSLEEVPEVKYYVSNGDAGTPLRVLALVACTRHRVEDFFEDGKGYLGMAQYETRSWVGWHHHMTLVGLAHLFVTLTRLRLKKSAGPDAGPDGAIAGGGVGGAGVDVAARVALVDYHIRRNQVAKTSHDKTWKEKHRGVIYLRL